MNYYLKHFHNTVYANNLYTVWSLNYRSSHASTFNSCRTKREQVVFFVSSYRWDKQAAVVILSSYGAKWDLTNCNNNSFVSVQNWISSSIPLDLFGAKDFHEKRREEKGAERKYASYCRVVIPKNSDDMPMSSLQLRPVKLRASWQHGMMGDVKRVLGPLCRLPALGQSTKTTRNTLYPTTPGTDLTLNVALTSPWPQSMKWSV